MDIMEAVKKLKTDCSSVDSAIENRDHDGSSSDGDRDSEDQSDSGSESSIDPNTVRGVGVIVHV